MIPLDEEKIVVESWKDIVIRFNGDPYRGRSRSVPSQKLYKSAKCWTLENVRYQSCVCLIVISRLYLVIGMGNSNMRVVLRLSFTSAGRSVGRNVHAGLR